MERIKPIKIAGADYLLNFSTRAANAVMEKYGTLGGINDAFFVKSDNESAGEKTASSIAAEVAWVLALLMREGAAYADIIEHRKVPALSAGDLQIVMSITELLDARGPVLEAVSAGIAATVEVEPDTKNAEATQSH